MKKNDMKKWVKALRSGEYSQCRYALHKVDSEGQSGFCTIGVAADTLLDRYWVEGNEFSHFNQPENDVVWVLRNKKEGINGNILTEKEIAELGMSVSVHDWITSLNDRGTMSFKRMANWIEKRWDKDRLEGDMGKRALI